MMKKFSSENPMPLLSIIKPTYSGDAERIFRIGYYNPNDGMDTVWLVNKEGKYEATWDQETCWRILIYCSIG